MYDRRTSPASIRPLRGLLSTQAIRAELLARRVLDRLAPPSGSSDPLLDDLTAVVKTFERPRIVRRLVDSIRRLYPGLRVIVVDDSRVPVVLPGVEVASMPYDSGVSAGRSLGVDRVETKYVMMLDDDFVLFSGTGLAAALRLMEAHPEIDLMGGKVINLPRFRVTDYRDKPLYPTPAAPVYPIGSHIGPLPVYDKVANFYVARTERLRLVGWDVRIKRVEHAEFFTRARGVLATVYNERLQCFHAQTPYDAHYMARRTDAETIEADRRLIQERYFARTGAPG